MQRIADRLGAAERVLLMTHQEPDGDALGSMLALGLALTGLGRRVVMHCQGDIPEGCRRLPGVEGLAADPGQPGDHDAVVLLDCHEFERVGVLAHDFSQVPLVAVIDHHITREDPPGLWVVDVAASSAGELVYGLIGRLGVTITPDIAVNLYTAIATDTGFFIYSNTSAETLCVAADLVRAGADPWAVYTGHHMNKPAARFKLLGLALTDMEFHFDGHVGLMAVTREMLGDTDTDLADTEGFVEFPRSVKGTELAMFLKEVDEGTYRVSLRSMGRLNAAGLAQRFGGGGHFQAAGCTVRGSLAEAKSHLLDAVSEMLPDADRGPA